MKLSVLLISSILLWVNCLTASEEFSIVIERQLETESCIQGYLFVNSVPVCYTIELPWRENRANISSIPAGTYDGFLRYDKNDGWRIQLVEVPGRTGIQIHIGNYTEEISGCTLVGMGVDTDRCALSDSETAYLKVKEAFYGDTHPVASPDKRITVTYR